MAFGDLVFVYTPGFNGSQDTHQSEVDILEMVAEWLKLTYDEDMCSWSSRGSSLQSIRTDTNSLPTPEFPSPLSPSRMEVMMEEDAIFEPEDQAWGSPPAFKWPRPSFSRNKTAGSKNSS